MEQLYWLPVFKADSQPQSCDSEASGGKAGNSAYKICLLVVSLYIHFFLWPCRIGRDVCSGDWDGGA